MVNCEIYADNAHSTQIISQKLLELCENYDDLAFVFIGTDANIGDSLGPICGELTADLSQNCFFYGNLKHTITAKDVPFLCNFTKKAHPSTFIVVIDAALGRIEDIGTIKICSGGIKPGLGVNKDLPLVGDVSIIGVVGEKKKCNDMTSVLRLGNVYKMAVIISDGIRGFFELKRRSAGSESPDRIYRSECKKFDIFT